MTVTNRIAECMAPNPLPVVHPLKWIVIHKTSLAELEPHNPKPIADDVLDGPLLVSAFCRGPMGFYTTNRAPYHVLVRTTGAAEQMLALDRVGAHARRYNYASLAVAVVGETPNRAQYESLVRVCAELALYARAPIVGHTDLPNASVDPAKRCPGGGLSIPELTLAVRSRLQLNAGSSWRALPTREVERRMFAAGYQLLSAISPT